MNAMLIDRCFSEITYTEIISSTSELREGGIREKERQARYERGINHTGDHVAHIPTVGEWHWENHQ